MGLYFFIGKIPVNNNKNIIFILILLAMNILIKNRFLSNWPNLFVYHVYNDTMLQFSLMDKLEQEKLIQFQAMKMLKYKVYCQDHWNFYFNKYCRNKEIPIFILK